MAIGAGSAYTNPGSGVNQSLIDKSFQTWEKEHAKNMDNSLKSLSASMAYNKAEREGQKALVKNQNDQIINAYNKVGELEEVGSATFDRNKDAFFNGQIDKYVEIKNGIEKGTIPANVGARALAKINEQVNKYKMAQPKILAEIQMLKQALQIPAGQPGAVSSRMPTDQQRVLLELEKGGNVNIIDRNGELVLYMPPTDDNPGGMINVNALMTMQETYLQKVPDISPILQGAATNILGSAEKGGGGLTADYVTFKKVKKDGIEYTIREMTETQRVKAKEALFATKQFDPIIDDEQAMRSIWADMMGRNTNWNPANEQMVNEAKEFLADRAIDENSALNGVKQIHQMKDVVKPTYKKPTQSQLKERDDNKYIMKIANEVKDFAVDEDKIKYLNKHSATKYSTLDMLIKEKNPKMTSSQRDTWYRDPNNKPAIDMIMKGKGIEGEFDPAAVYQVDEDGEWTKVDMDMFDNSIDVMVTDQVVKSRDKTKEKTKAAVTGANPLKI